MATNHEITAPPSHFLIPLLTLGTEDFNQNRESNFYGMLPLKPLNDRAQFGANSPVSQSSHIQNVTACLKGELGSSLVYLSMEDIVKQKDLGHLKRWH